MSKSTPGPWFVFGNGHCVGGPFTQTDHAGVCDDPEQKTAGVAMCGMRLRTAEEAEANALLIAAAPEMFSALRSWVAIFEREGAYVSPLVAAALRETQDAIAKAQKGEAS
jgi:hypothetical protein